MSAWTQGGLTVDLSELDRLTEAIACKAPGTTIDTGAATLTSAKVRSLLGRPVLRPFPGIVNLDACA